MRLLAWLTKTTNRPSGVIMGTEERSLPLAESPLLVVATETGVTSAAMARDIRMHVITPRRIPCVRIVLSSLIKCPHRDSKNRCRKS